MRRSESSRGSVVGIFVGGMNGRPVDEFPLCLFLSISFHSSRKPPSKKLEKQHRRIFSFSLKQSFGLYHHLNSLPSPHTRIRRPPPDGHTPVHCLWPWFLTLQSSTSCCPRYTRRSPGTPLFCGQRGVEGLACSGQGDEGLAFRGELMARQARDRGAKDLHPEGVGGHHGEHVSKYVPRQGIPP